MNRGISTRRLVSLLASVIAVAASACQPAALRGPVSGFDAPDPHIMRVGATYYLYTTNSGPQHVPMRTSTDLVNWSDPIDALPVMADWATAYDVWAPAATYTDGRYVLWYSAILGATHCIDRAIASGPAGPFRVLGDDPFFCQNLGSTHVIDPYPFQAPDGSQYLYWADDSSPHVIMGAALDASGLNMVGTPQRLTAPSAPWEGRQVENPAMIAAGAGFQLYYSANDWNSRNYATGYLNCLTPLGPCTKATLTRPFLATKGSVISPGGMSFFTTTTGEQWMAYHAWDNTVGYRQGGQRSLHVEPFELHGNEPVVPNRPPVAALDTAVGGSGSFAVSGWAYDPDSPTPRAITITDFTSGATVRTTANAARPDVLAAEPAALGPFRGFRATVGAAAGDHTVCLAVDDDLSGALDWFTCATVTVR